MDIHPQIVSASVAGLAALVGGFAGVLFSYWSNKKLKLREWRLQVLKDQSTEKRSAYAELIAKAYSISTLAATQCDAKLTEFSALDMAYAKVELMASDEVVAAARELTECVLDRFSAEKPKVTDRFVRAKVAFVKAARRELADYDSLATAQLD